MNSPASALAEAEQLVARDRVFDAIELLVSANRAAADATIERRLVELRHAAFERLPPSSVFAAWPPSEHVRTASASEAVVPEITGAELSAATVRTNVLEHGCLLVRHVLDHVQVARFVSGIDRAFEALAAGRNSRERESSWYTPLPVSKPETESLGRHWVYAAGGVLTADSPKLLFQLFDTFEDVGLREVVTEYLGERPVLSANKCTMRCVKLDAGTEWHQDGAFLGKGIRALNVWVALTDCGVDPPGLDVVPRRFETTAATGGGGAIFDWSVSPQAVAELAGDAPVVRPVFAAGDALLFDDLFLHRTAIDASMSKPRYAIESWFFGATGYPSGQVPIVW